MNLPQSLPEPLPYDPGQVLLPANGTTVAAEDLHAALVLAADQARTIRIDASLVENVGQAVLQLLLAASIDAATRGLDFVIVRPSDAFRARVEACLLSGPLNLLRGPEQGR